MNRIPAIAVVTAVAFAAAFDVTAQQSGQQGVQLEDPLKGQLRATETTLDDQTDVAVTVYNNNLALVRDRRKIKLFPGEIGLKFMDVAQQIRPETVSLRSITDADSLRIIEQNYEYDLMSPQKLMEKYVGKTVRLVNFSNEVGFTSVDAELLSVNEGPVYRVDGEIYLGHPGSVALPELPKELIAKPSLIWLLDNDGEEQDVEATYLTGGIQWRADYVLRVNKEETQLAIDAWVTLDNSSGATYTNAKLKLVAGDVNIAQPPMAPMARGGAVEAVAFQQMGEESFAEYHLYTLERRTTIKQNQSKQVSLFNADGVKISKKYEFRGQNYYFFQPSPAMPEEKVGVFVEFENEEANQLGVPLPGGVMRLYQEDSEGMLQFAGEDRIQHTPKDETVRLRMGSAFDVVGERVQTDYTVVSNRVFESSYRITLRNHKETDIVIEVVEPMTSDWEILQSSIPHEKRDAMTAVFAVPVKADGEVELTYRVRVRR